MPYAPGERTGEAVLVHCREAGHKGIARGSQSEIFAEEKAVEHGDKPALFDITPPVQGQ